MDRITESLPGEFSKEHELTELPENQRFEDLCSDITVRRYFDETFDTADIVTGSGDEASGNDTGIGGRRGRGLAPRQHWN